MDLRTDLSKKIVPKPFLPAQGHGPLQGRMQNKNGGLGFLKSRTIPPVGIILRTGGSPYFIITIIDL